MFTFVQLVASNRLWLKVTDPQLRTGLNGSLELQGVWRRGKLSSMLGKFSTRGCSRPCCSSPPPAIQTRPSQHARDITITLPQATGLMLIYLILCTNSISLRVFCLEDQRKKTYTTKVKWVLWRNRQVRFKSQCRQSDFTTRSLYKAFNPALLHSLSDPVLDMSV